MEPKAGLLLVQRPPPVPSLIVIVEPMHTFVGPLIGAGIGSTVIVALAVQPVEASVNEMTDVPVVVLTPVTTPVEAPTVAIPGLALLHVPLPEMSDNVIVLPVHTSNELVLDTTGAGKGKTLTVVVAAHPVTGNV